jgi:hypothetical protein
LVTETKLKKLKIDVVNELHGIRRKNAGASSAQIERVAAEVLEEIRKREK